PLALKEYYPNAFVNPSDVGMYAPSVLANYATDRNALCNALTEVNSEVGASAGTFESIELLRCNDTVAVLTGQQAGLFSGPLYTIYKAMTAIKEAEVLTAKGVKAVPVFWAATDDHDFDEVAETSVIGRGSELMNFSYRPAGYKESSQVGSVQVDAGIESVIAELLDSIEHTEFSDELRSILRGWTIGTAFMKQLAVIFAKYGLIFVDPMKPKIKQLAAPIFEKAVQHSDEIVSALTERSSKLVAQGFHAQVVVEDDYFPLFWIDDDGGRHALRGVGNGTFRVKDDRREFTTVDLETLARDQPEGLSPGVMLRPVVQDFLFPTICYFGGGAEIAYFAQNSEVYRVLERPVTPVFHRQSFTVTEAAQRRSMERLELSLADLFDGQEAVTMRAAEKYLTPETPVLFAEVEETINSELNRLDQAVSNIDTTLAANLATRRRKIIYHIAALREKTLRAHLRNDETFRRRLDALFAGVLPNDGLQERTINVVSFLNKYGLNFVDWVYDAIDLDDKEHRIIEL
ncbi:MAG: bacillithiol biosynthesis cysteine-adding enzyme BshC, partial [Pyrinomonadaceae bacterium]